MDPPCCAEGMGTHQGLEQGGRARSKGGKGRRGPRTLQDAGRSHTGAPEHQDAAEGTPSPTIAGNWRTRVGSAFQGRHHFANWNGTTVAGRRFLPCGSTSRTEAVTTRHSAYRRSWHRHWTTQSSRGGCDATRTLQPSRREKRASMPPSTIPISSGNRCQNCWKQFT